MDSKSVIIFNHKMLVGAHDSLGLLSDIPYEHSITHLLKDNIHAGDTVFDIGANIGFHSLMMARLVRSTGQVHAFEPDMETFSILLRNIQINNYSNIIPIQKAVLDENGKVRLCRDLINNGAHHICSSVDTGEAIVVDCLRLDDYCDGYYSKIDFIKMDIEGSEMCALKGMKRLIESNTKLKMVLEYFPAALKRYDTEAKELIGYLLERGFDIFHIDDCNLVPFDFNNVVRQFNIENEHLTNIFCTKS